MGILHVDSGDFTCWAPEAIELYQKVADGFVSRLEGGVRACCDLWSLGIIIYTIIARRPPILGSREQVQTAILARNWSFNVMFDSFDHEAKELVEQLLASQANKRIKPEVALYNPWIRRNWKSGADPGSTFEKLDEFCSCSLPKRLFGRFLVKFLDADHMHKIAEAFYSLDTQGDGAIDAKDLRMAAKFADCDLRAVDTITGWLCVEGGTHISLTRFAVCQSDQPVPSG